MKSKRKKNYSDLGQEEILANECELVGKILKIFGLFDVNALVLLEMSTDFKNDGK